MIGFLKGDHPPGVCGWYSPVGQCEIEDCANHAQPRIHCNICERALCMEHAIMVYPKEIGQSHYMACPEHGGNQDG